MSSLVVPGFAEGRSLPPEVPEIARPPPQAQNRLRIPSPALVPAPVLARWNFDSVRYR